ncbi:MAG: hypothetical protein A2298_02630 [Gammaproteobacteria bacterium RIFOXYB2_FULL_38_6]|nr:MAG: hypothetical protein A2298_02630 [Gammaproteobacteria bacterium RIFOXYB2_FULL_38_6]
MKRLYQSILATDLKETDKMLFLAGPRQVGKTTLAKDTKNLTSHFHYLNWDNDDNKKLILQGPKSIVEKFQLDIPTNKKPILVFDEIHKYVRWKNFIKGFFDTYRSLTHVIVTGSAKLHLYQKGGDSMAGRYFLYRIHPLSVRECIHSKPNLDSEISLPKKISDKDFEHLLKYSGYPEPFLKHNLRFYNRWQNLLDQQLFREDIRDISKTHDLVHLELLAEILQHQTGQLINASNLSTKIHYSYHTVNKWLSILTQVYYCFLVQPWTKNVNKSLSKQPKVYLWNWTRVLDEGKQAENFIAAHLLKAVHFWTDIGLGEYKLHFIRDRDKNEVDFLVVKNKKPWFLVEVKLSSSQPISKNLIKFQEKLGVKHAFQVVLDKDYEEINCFNYERPIIVPAKTFLSQLV